MKIIGNMKNLILTLVFGLISLVSNSQTPPVMVVGNQTYDFGRIEYTKDTLVAHFWFKNQGVGELKIYQLNHLVDAQLLTSLKQHQE